MRLSPFRATLVSLPLLAACGKTETPPPVPTPAPAVTPTPTADTPPPVVDPALPTVVEPSPVPPPKVATGPSYVVWIAAGDQTVSTWLAPAEGGYRAVATRAQLTVFADETLWGADRPVTPYQEISCEAFEGETDDAPAKPDGKIHTVEHLAVRGLAGAAAGTTLPITPKLPDYFQKDPDAKGVYAIIGDLGGRQLSVVGGAGDLVLVVDCANAFSCGAHGDSSCQFIPFTFDDAAAKPDLKAATTALAGATKGMMKAWTEAAEGEELADPAVQAVSMRFVNGAPAAEYLFAAGVSYASTDGDWGSYTQSRKHTGPVVPELNLPEVPAEVAAWLATQQVTAAYGWSAVPVDADPTILAAFREAATIPAPGSVAPAGEPAPGAAE